MDRKEMSIYPCVNAQILTRFQGEKGLAMGKNVVYYGIITYG